MDIPFLALIFVLTTIVICCVLYAIDIIYLRCFSFKTRLLLKKKNSFASDKTALIWATRQGDAEAVKFLLAAEGIDVNHTDEVGNTALIWAAYRGNAKVVKFLLAAEGIDVNYKDRYGQTALMWAARRGNLKVVNLISDFIDKQRRGTK